MYHFSKSDIFICSFQENNVFRGTPYLSLSKRMCVCGSACQRLTLAAGFYDTLF